MTFNALLTEQIADREFTTTLQQRRLDDLPVGELLIRVSYSSLNYKDALSALGNPGVTRNFPHTPGIDAVGEIEQSSSDAFAVGDQVIVTGYDLGMNTDGGLAEYIRVPASWALPLPDGLAARQAMVLGTAGLTAGLCVEKLLHMGAAPEHGQVLVTGATGGVGSVAVALLSKLGFKVAASTGKPAQEAMLRELGARDIIARDELSEAVKKPLLKPRWHYAIDCVGGDTLVNVLKSLMPSGSVACCGLAGSADFPASVLPFILRDINLLGVDSVEIPLARKRAIWQLFAGDWALPNLEPIVTEVSLEQSVDYLSQFVTGQIAGRIVVNF